MKCVSLGRAPVPGTRSFVEGCAMQVYTVRKPGPNTDREFQAYIDLLEEIGLDIASVPRTPEPGSTNRWLYVWQSRPHAERFARELGGRLRDSSWAVHEFDIPDEERGPLAPLVIRAIPTTEGTAFRLDPKSQSRVMHHFPNAKLVGEVSLPWQVRDDDERQYEPVWNQVIINLTGISDESIDRLGGVRILAENGKILHERVPTNVHR
jgi:hypothetical protein